MMLVAAIVPAVKNAVARWSGTKVRFGIESGSGHAVATDEAPAFGDDSAMRPTELLLAALAGCTGTNAILLLKKFKQPLRSLDVEVEGQQDEEWPKAFNKIDITFHCGWDGKTDQKLVEQALDMACNRYCPIHATLSKGTKITHRHEDAR
jgi:putative redox protein